MTQASDKYLPAWAVGAENLQAIRDTLVGRVVASIPSRRVDVAYDLLGDLGPLVDRLGPVGREWFAAVWADLNGVLGGEG